MSRFWIGGEKIVWGLDYQNDILNHKSLGVGIKEIENFI
jgi:hypothetical protein